MKSLDLLPLEHHKVTFVVPSSTGHYAEKMLRYHMTMEGAQRSIHLTFSFFIKFIISQVINASSKSNVLARLGTLENTLDYLQNIPSLTSLDRHIFFLSSLDGLG